MRTVFSLSFTFVTIRANLKEKTVAQCDFGPISSNSTVAHASFYKLYLKQQMEFLGFY